MVLLVPLADMVTFLPLIGLLLASFMVMVIVDSATPSAVNVIGLAERVELLGDGTSERNVMVV